MRAEWVVVLCGLYLLAVVQVSSMAASVWAQNKPCEPPTLTMDRVEGAMFFTVGGNCPLDYAEYELTVSGDPSCGLGGLEWTPGPTTRRVEVQGQVGARCVVHVSHVAGDVGAWEFVAGGAG